MTTAEPTIAIQTVEPVPEILVPQGEVHEIRGVNHWAVPGTPECEQFDRLELKLLELPQAQMRLVHRFTRGADGKSNLYIRELHVPAGTMTTTKIHLTEHPFVISKGRISIRTENGGMQHLEAPYCGITKPGTRRIIMHHTDTVLTTFHVTNLTDPDKIEEQIILKHDGHLKAAGVCPDLSGGCNHQSISP
jgi:hypothetical protein